MARNGESGSTGRGWAERNSIMMEYLHAFAVGISFTVGVTVGAILCRLATREGLREMRQIAAENSQRIEERLAKYVTHTERIAVALETLTREKRNNA